MIPKCKVWNPPSIPDVLSSRDTAWETASSKAVLAANRTLLTLALQKLIPTKTEHLMDRLTKPRPPELPISHTLLAGPQIDLSAAKMSDFRELRSITRRWSNCKVSPYRRESLSVLP